MDEGHHIEASGEKAGLPRNGWALGGDKQRTALLHRWLEDRVPEVRWEQGQEVSQVLGETTAVQAPERSVLVVEAGVLAERAAEVSRLCMEAMSGPAVLAVLPESPESLSAVLCAGADALLHRMSPPDGASTGEALRRALLKAVCVGSRRQGVALERALLRIFCSAPDADALASQVTALFAQRVRLQAALFQQNGRDGWVRRGGVEAGGPGTMSPSDVEAVMEWIRQGQGAFGGFSSGVRGADSAGAVLLRSMAAFRSKDPETVARLAPDDRLQELLLLPLPDGGQGLLWVASERIGALHEERVQAILRCAPALAAALERTAAQAAHVQREERARLLAEALGFITLAVDPSGRRAESEPAWERYTGRRIADAEDSERWLEAFHPEDRETVMALFADTTTGVREVSARMWHSDSDAYRHVSLRAVPSLAGREVGWLVAITDTHEEVLARQEREALEAQLRQAQRMEAVGRLAGGVAHDLNNLLTVIQGNSYLLSSVALEHPELSEEVRSISHAAQRASELTGRLLTFSRKTPLRPQVLDLNAVCEDLESMLRRSIGEDVELRFHYAPDLPPVEADPGQVEQVLMNLLVNARDAMPSGGLVTVETAAVELGESLARVQLVGRPGRHVMLAVTDTGVGMDEETQARIFDPFFTTKDPGKGTGLGLAVVYSIVKQNGGHIFVTSTKGVGTTFKVFLPALESGAGSGGSGAGAGDRVPRPATARLGGTETVLLAEDEGTVRRIVRQILEHGGYEVLVGADGPEALTLAERYDGPIQILVADLLMPQMNGVELARKLRRERPECRVLFISGYAPEAVVSREELRAEGEFLAKPFSPRQLLAAVRKVLDQD